MDKVLLTIEEAAERLSIGRTRTYALVAKGMLESVTIGRSRRIPVDALEPFIATLRRVGEAEQQSATMECGCSCTAPADRDAVQP